MSNVPIPHRCVCPLCGDEHFESEEQGPVVPTKRCPICWTYGHTHRKGCHYEHDGMLFHIPLSYKEKPK